MLKGDDDDDDDDDNAVVVDEEDQEDSGESDDDVSEGSLSVDGNTAVDAPVTIAHGTFDEC